MAQSAYYVDSIFAENLYLSCAEVPLTNQVISIQPVFLLQQKAKVRQLYKNAQQFVDWVIGLNTNTAITVFFVNQTANDNTTKSISHNTLQDDTIFAFYTETTPCNSSCGCSSCNQSCSAIASEVAKPPHSIIGIKYSWKYLTFRNIRCELYSSGSDSGFGFFWLGFCAVYLHSSSVLTQTVHSYGKSSSLYRAYRCTFCCTDLYWSGYHWNRIEKL